jgi:hypothetical protein
MSQNTIRVVAAELYAGALASHFTQEKTTAPLQALISFLMVAPMTEARYFKTEVDTIANLIKTGRICDIIDQEISRTSSSTPQHHLH